ncbi:helix-turn-helix transcriptional regulator [Spirillospora sp. NPDC047279]|uniref:helix-turn-helix domain-containing protein n=1 Tax=Spirillospora sp. NPDC047279 TaxID=3155478 RepID=UPI0033CE0572
MGTERVIDVPSDGLTHGRAGPTVLRLVVGAQLRRLRENRGITAEEAAYEIRGSASKISRMELGRVRFKDRDVSDLLTFYGVDELTDRLPLLEMAQQASTAGWWQPYSDLVPPWFEAYLGLEQGASMIRCYEVQFVPGLLQTDGYARAIVETGMPRAGENEVERRVALRRERKRVLTRPEPLRLWAILDEAAVRRPFGDRDVMRAQLRHLIEMNELPHVTVQISPFSAGGHGAGGPISILRLPAADLPDVVYLEQLTNAFYPDKQSDIFHYTDVMNRLAVQSAPASATPKLLRSIIDEM